MMAMLLLAAVLLFAGSMVFVLWLVRRALHVVPPSSALLISGPRQPGGRSYRVVRGGRYLQRPLVELVEILDLGPLEVRAPLAGLSTRDEALLSGSVTASVSMDLEEPSVSRAVTRLVGLPPSDIQAMAERVLAYATRAVLADLSAAKVGQDPEALADRILEVASAQLVRLGLHCERPAVNLE